MFPKRILFGKGYPSGKTATYTYDAWGKVTENATSADTQNITETNPIRYRGYYYDTETRLYYLKSRYYDPVVKRFLNADGLISTGIEDVCKNMFAYCKNDPVNMADSSGNDPVPAWALHIISGSATESEYAKALSVNPNAWSGSAGYRVRHAIELAKQHFSNKNNEFGRSKNKEFTQRKDKKRVVKTEEKVEQEKEMLPIQMVRNIVESLRAIKV